MHNNILLVQLYFTKIFDAFESDSTSSIIIFQVAVEALNLVTKFVEFDKSFQLTQL